MNEPGQGLNTVEYSKEERRRLDRGEIRHSTDTCQSCGRIREWWWTAPGRFTSRKLIPLTAETLQPHWKGCRYAFCNPPQLPIKRPAYIKQRW